MQEKIREYLEWKGTYAHRASINYKIWLERFVQVCGDKALEEYNVADIVKYRCWLETRYSPCTVQFSTIVIKNFFNFYKQQDFKCLSPALIKTPRIQAKSHRAVTEEELNKIVSVMPNNEFRPLRDLIMVLMLWDTGVRVSELCDLDVFQISEGETSAVIATKKNGKKRIIVWSAETHQLLMKYMPIRLELHKYNQASALFVGQNNNKSWTSRLTTRSVERIIKYYVSKAGIREKITPHSFRHGWAHKRRDQNAPLAFIQKGLGHNNPISTFIYEQYNDSEFKQNAKFYLV